MNAPYLESSEQIDSFFPYSPHKVKFYIFQNISKCLIHRSRPFKYKNTYEICDNIQDKDNRVIIMANTCFVFHEEVIDVFHNKIYTPTIEKLQFHLTRVRILGSIELGNTSNQFFILMH